MNNDGFLSAKMNELYAVMTASTCWEVDDTLKTFPKNKAKQFFNIMINNKLSPSDMF